MQSIDAMVDRVAYASVHKTNIISYVRWLAVVTGFLDILYSQKIWQDGEMSLRRRFDPSIYGDRQNWPSGVCRSKEFVILLCYVGIPERSYCSRHNRACS